MVSVRLRQRKIILYLTGVLFLTLLGCVLRPSDVRAASKFSADVRQTKLLVGEETEIVTSGKGIAYKFKSSNKKVASVSKAGFIKAKKEGKAVITIRGMRKTKDGKTLVGEKKVKVRVYACSFTQTSLTVAQGAVYNRLKIKGKTLNRRIRYTSSDPSACVVDGSGVVRGVREGFADITIQVGNYITYICKVSVTAQYLGSFSKTLLVNPGHRYGTVDIRQWFSEAAKTPVSIIQTDVTYPSLGDISGTQYHADHAGNAEITAWGGPYSITFNIRQIAWQAHRGYMDIRPENTNDAFEAAAVHGACRIETDVRFTKDGEIVLLHDSKVDSMTDGEGSVSSKTLEEVRALQITNGNGLAYCNDRHIPLLKEYLSICRRYGIVAVLHVKTFGSAKVQAERAQKLYKEIEEMGMLHQTLIIAANAVLLQIFRNNTNTVIPLAAIEGAISTYQSLNIANCSLVSNSIFGSATSSNYSPVIGRQGLDPLDYRA